MRKMARGQMAKGPSEAARAAGRRLARGFFAVDPVTLAQRLLGQRLVRVLDDGTGVAGVIVETEAYLGVEDRAAHTFGGRRTERVEAMYGKPGTAYVYFTYGMHWCMNVVAGREGEPVAVLLRALEPVEGIEAMRRLRSARRRPGAAALNVDDLCSGPAKLCEAMVIDRRLNGLDLVSDARLFVEPGRERVTPERVVNSARIGVSYAGVWARRPLRWHVADNPHVSVAGSGNRVSGRGGSERGARRLGRRGG